MLFNPPQPAIYLVISYFMAGLSADWRFIAMLSLTMLYCIAVHSVGLFIGAVVMDGKRAAVGLALARGVDSWSVLRRQTLVFPNGAHISAVPSCLVRRHRRL